MPDPFDHLIGFGFIDDYQQGYRRNLNSRSEKKAPGVLQSICGLNNKNYGKIRARNDLGQLLAAFRSGGVGTDLLVDFDLLNLKL
ncbi:MAG TPA: hypothetical protein VLB46_22870 [Pyrinomonadaceae bacterium]|nr:hypothetical protein [Pyrinomonadaceae bacterium]